MERQKKLLAFKLVVIHVFRLCLFFQGRVVRAEGAGYLYKFLQDESTADGIHIMEPLAK